jgi:hypothetical protein
MVGYAELCLFYIVYQCHFKTIYNIYLSSLDKSTLILGADVILAFITSPKFLSIILIFTFLLLTNLHLY